MKTPIAYYGGKSRWADDIVAMFPKHRVYVEPFAGSAAVLFAKRRAVHEIVNDVDGDLVNFFRVLRERPADLELACRLSPYSREEYDLCQQVDESLDDLERARRWWVRSSQSFSQTGHATGWSVSVVRGANNARSVWNRIERFAGAAERLGGVTIEHRDGVEVVERYDGDVVHYIDPPYLGEVRTSFGGGRRPGGDYKFEFATEDDHRRLGAQLTRCRGAVFVSGYPSDLYEGLFAGWHRSERDVTRHASNGRGTTATVTEVIWSNRPLTHAPMLTWAEEVQAS